MNNEDKQSSIKNEVLEKIKEHKIKMHPKIYFILKAVAFIVLVTILVVFTISLIGLIIVSAENNGARLLIHLGPRGILAIIYSLPWIFILVFVVAIVFIEKLIKKLNIAYRRPLIYSLLLILIIVVFCGFFAQKSPIHKKLSCWIMSFYDNDKSIPMQNVYRGKILEVSDNQMRVENSNGQTIDVIMPLEMFKPDEKEIDPGDKIIFIGRNKNTKINISNFRKLNCGCGKDCF